MATTDAEVKAVNPEVVKETAEAGARAAADKLAELLAKLPVEQVLQHFSVAAERAAPLINTGSARLQDLSRTLEPHRVDVLLPGLLGLALVLSGGLFPQLIVAVEAVRASGAWPGLRSSVGTLRSNYASAKAAAKKDDSGAKKDLRQAAREDAMILIKSLNTDVLKEALHKGGVALFAVLAAVRLRLAYAITVSASVSAMAHGWCGDVLTEALTKALPPDARRLAPEIVSSSLRAAAFGLALLLARPIFALYIAMTGARMATDAALQYAELRGQGAQAARIAPHRAQVCAALGAAGFAWQCYTGFQTGYVATLLLLPLVLAEGFLTVVLGVLA